jgi:hypothetical protein
MSDPSEKPALSVTKLRPAVVKICGSCRDVMILGFISSEMGPICGECANSVLTVELAAIFPEAVSLSGVTAR